MIETKLRFDRRYFFKNLERVENESVIFFEYYIFQLKYLIIFLFNFKKKPKQ